MEQLSPQWWKLESDKAAKAMQGIVDAITIESQSIHLQNVQSLRFYTSNPHSEMTISNYIANAQNRARQNFLDRSARLNWNVIKSSIDSLTSKIAKEKIRPSFLTNGSWVEQKQRADRCNDFLFGAMMRGNFYKINKQIFKDGCIFGTAFCHVYREKNKKGKWCIKAERVFPDEIIVDPFDGYYGQPKTLYRMKYVSKEVLRGWGVPDTTIARLKTAANFGTNARTTETVQVVQGWHLATNDEPGRMMIISDGRMIYEEEYTRSCFPIVEWRYTQEPIGYFGKGIAEELTGDQVEINRILNFIKESMMLCSNPRTYVQIGSKVAKQTLTNKIGGIVEYAGQPPVIQATQAVSGDVFAHLDRLWARAYEKIGLNELQISGRNQLGAGASGVALREHNDIQSERFAETQQNWEDFHCEVGKLFMLEAKEISEDEGDYVVSVSSMDKGTFELKYSDIALPDDSYAIQVFPRSALPKTPGARLQWISEMQAKGFLDIPTATELLNFPDLKSHNMLNETANIRSIIEKIITQDAPKDSDRWLYIAPEPYMDVPLAMETGRKYYVLLLNELPEKTSDEQEDKNARLDLLRRWIDDCEKLMSQAQPPSQGMAMPGGQQPMPMPEQGQLPQGMNMPQAGMIV